MNVIDEMMRLEAALWIQKSIAELPDRARFRAWSAVRSLEWASRNFHGGMPIPAAYFALHATEEAVAAFVSCAKECGYSDDAKINLRDHMAKSVVSLLAQKISNMLADFRVGLALEPQTDKLVVRFTVNCRQVHHEASVKLFQFTEGADGDRKVDFLDEIIEAFGSVGALKQTVMDGQTARNAILYATSNGLPTGFDDPVASLKRECQLSLGLIWAAIDTQRNRHEVIPFIAQALKTANRVIAEVRAK